MADAKLPPAMPLPDAMAGNFQDAVRWFNQMWAGANDPGAAARVGGPIPSVMMPTLDLKELDKRIADLRSVEHWLKLNQGLVQTTIQGLEMQRNTIAAWQSFGAAAAATTSATAAPQGAPAARPEGAAPDAAGFDPTAWWGALQQQFAQMAASAAATNVAAPATPPGDAARADPDAAPEPRTGGKAGAKPRSPGGAP